MVAVGDTFLLPAVATAPMPWVIDTDVALVDDHVNVAKAPDSISAGDADKVSVGAGVGTETVTVASAVAEPTALVAVMV